MPFEIVGDITQVNMTAVGNRIRDLRRLRRLESGVRDSRDGRRGLLRFRQGSLGLLRLFRSFLLGRVVPVVRSGELQQIAPEKPGQRPYCEWPEIRLS